MIVYPFQKSVNGFEWNYLISFKNTNTHSSHTDTHVSNKFHFDFFKSFKFFESSSSSVRSDRVNQQMVGLAVFAAEKKILFIYHYRHCPANKIPKEEKEMEKRNTNRATQKRRENPAKTKENFSFAAEKK